MTDEVEKADTVTPPAGAADPLAAALETPPVQSGGEPDWRETLSPEFRDHDVIKGFQKPDDMAKSLIETQAWARGRVALPKDGDDASFAEFAGKLRPATADDYTIEVPEGQSDALATGIKPILHEAGLHPKQAEIIAKGFNQVQADIMQRQAQEGADSLKSLEVDLGSHVYNQRVVAVQNMLAAVGIDAVKEGPALAASLQTLSGTARGGLEALFKLAERTGEIGKVDGVDVNLMMGSMSAEQAQKEIDRMRGDATVRERIYVDGSAERKRYDQLNLIIAQKSAG